MEQQNIGGNPLLPPQQQQLWMGLTEAEYSRRIRKVMKLFFMHMVGSYFLVNDTKKRDIYVQCTEALQFTIYYCVRTKDVHFFERLLITQFLGLAMMFYIKPKVGQYILLSIAQLTFPGYKYYVYSLYVRLFIQSTISYVCGYNIYQFSHIVFYLLETGRCYIYTFEYKDTTDLTLASIAFLGFYSVMEKGKLEYEDVFSMAILLYLWGICKSFLVPFTGTLMTPTPPTF